MEDNEEFEGICCDRYPVQAVVVGVLAHSLWLLDKQGFLSFDGVSNTATYSGLCANALGSEHLRLFRDMGIIDIDIATDSIFKGKNFEAIMESLRPLLHFTEDEFMRENPDV